MKSLITGLAIVFGCLLSLATNVLAAPEGVVFLSQLEELDAWTHNDSIELAIDRTHRKIGSDSLQVDFTVQRDRTGASFLTLKTDGLSRVPKEWHFYALVEEDPRYKMGHPKLQMIVQDRDGTVKLADVDQKVDRPNDRAPWAEVSLASTAFHDLWPGDNGELDNIETVTFAMPHRVGEIEQEGRFTIWIDELAAVYGDTAQWGDRKLQQIKIHCKQLEQRLDSQSDGSWKAFPSSSLAVVDTLSDYIAKDLHQNNPVRGARQLRQLRQICDEIEQKLSQVEAGGNPWPSVKQVNRLNLEVRDGTYHDDQTPVYLGGLCGHWLSIDAFKRYLTLGFSGASTEVGPKSTLPERGKTRTPEGIKSLLDVASTHNLAIDVLLSPHYVPKWYYQKYEDLDPGKLRRRRNPFMKWNIDSRGLRDMVSQHLNVLIPLIRDEPSLVSYDLANELWYGMYGDFKPSDFRNYLKRRYQIIARLNQQWGSSFPTFREVQIDFKSPGAVCDLFAYNNHRVTRFFDWYIKELHKYDTKHPAYIKLHGENRQVIGANRSDLAKLLTANGSDAYPRMGSDEGLLVNAWDTAFETQQFRSLAPGKPIIDSEEHLIFYGQVVTPQYIRSMRWWRAVLGLDAYYVWVWGRREQMNEGTLMSQPAALNSLIHTGFELQNRAELVQAFQTYSSDVLLVESGPHVRKAYKLMSFAGRLFDILPIDRLDASKLNQYRTVVLPPDSKFKIPASVEAKVIRLQNGDMRKPAALSERVDSSMSVAYKPRWGMISYTVPGIKNKPTTFLLNLSGQVIGLDVSNGKKRIKPLKPVILSAGGQVEYRGGED